MTKTIESTTQNLNCEAVDLISLKNQIYDNFGTLKSWINHAF